MQTGRQNLVAQRERRLQNSGGAGSTFEMADILLN